MTKTFTIIDEPDRKLKVSDEGNGMLKLRLQDPRGYTTSLLISEEEGAKLSEATKPAKKKAKKETKAK